MNFPDRVLTPQSIRDAVEKCSAKKIEEIEVEIPALKPIFQKIRASQNKVIPLDVVAFGFEREEVIFLEQNGILLEDGGQYYMPEIFRLGFGYKLDRGARPKVLTLARRSARR